MSWAIAFVTMERSIAAQGFVRSARRVFPDVPIFVADQSKTLGPMAEFYEAERVNVIRMPFDAGLSASRNALVDAMDVDYFALCDDDFILGPGTSFASAVHILDADDEIGVIGGMLHDYDGTLERIRNWEMFFDHDEKNGRFTATPIYNYLPRKRQVAGNTLYLCDAVMNFAVFRKAMFSETIRWDERFKINGEHEDFFLNLKKNSSYRVAYLPSMTALHRHVRPHARYVELRARNDGRNEFLNKWGLNCHLEIGSGGRPLYGTPVRDWFSNDPCNSPIDRTQPKKVSMSFPAGIAHMQLYGAKLPDERPVISPPRECESLSPWLEPDPSCSAPIPAGHVLFSYDPWVRPDGELHLWHRATDPSETVRERASHGNIVFRWFSSEGDVLVWESGEQTINWKEDRYWQALVSPLPLWPQGAGYLRFEVISACPKRTPLATGFVFAEIRTQDNLDLDEPCNVLALCRTTLEVEGLAVSNQRVTEFLASAHRIETKFLRCNEQPWITMDLLGLDLVGIVDNRGAGLPIVLATGLRRTPSAALSVALPITLVQDLRVVLFTGYKNQAENLLRTIDPRVINKSGAEYPDAGQVESKLARGIHVVGIDVKHSPRLSPR